MSTDTLADVHYNRQTDALSAAVVRAAGRRLHAA